MDPYVIVTRLRDSAEKFGDAYWRFDDRAQQAISAAADRYEAREPMTKWYDVLGYGLYWFVVGCNWFYDCIALSRPVQAWQKRQKAKLDQERAGRRWKLDVQIAAEIAWQRDHEARLREEANRRHPSPVPTLDPMALLTPQELAIAQAAAEEKRKKFLTDSAKRDWNARNVRLSDAKYWDDPSDPRRWYNPPFPG